MTRLEVLLDHWQDDALAPGELAELVALLEEPDNRRVLVEQFCLAQALREALPLVEAPVLVSPAAGIDNPTPHGASGNRRVFLAIALLLGVLLAGAVLIPPASAPVVARLVEVQGVVEIVLPSGETQRARSGQWLLAGQTLRTGEEESFAALVYPDLTRLELHADTVIRLGRSRSGERQIDFSSGMVRADVPSGLRAQPLVVVSPRVELHTRESRVVLAAPSPDTMRVDLETGNASLVRPGEGQVVEMEGGSWAVTGTNQPLPVVHTLAPSITLPLRRYTTRGLTAVAYGQGGELLAANHRRLDRILGPGKIRTHVLPTRKGDGRVVFSADGRFLAVSGPGTLNLCDTLTGAVSRRISIDFPVRTLAIAPHGGWLATDFRKGQVALWDLEGDEPRLSLSPGTRIVQALAISPDGNLLVADAGARGRAVSQSLLLYDAGTGVVKGRLEGLRGPTRLLRFRSDGRMLASCGPDGSIRLWDIDERKFLRTIHTHERPVTALAFSPDGSRLAAGTADGQVLIWDVSTTEQKLLVRAGTRAVVGLAFSPDGRRLATCGPGMLVQEWEIDHH